MAINFGVDCRNGSLCKELASTLQTRCARSINGGGVAMIPRPEDYLVRRLTPTECARLQGMPDDWCSKVPHKDSAEYKLWGNGMALPCILYVMEGAVEVLLRRQLEELFDDTGEEGE